MFNGLYKLVEKLRPTFDEGGKLHALHSLFDGFDTFLFTPNTTSKRIGSQIHDGSDSKRTMILVIMALVPAMLFGMFNVGYQHLLATGELVRGGMTCALWWKAFGFGLLAVLPYIIVSYAVGLGIEFTVAQWKKEEIQEGFLVTGFIIPLIVPINTPLWMVAIATAFAVIFAKEVFGGTGYNIFNVALITRAFLFFAYPTHMTGDAAFVRTGGTWGWDGGKTIVDGFSGATPLTQIATTTDASLMPVDFWTAFNGLIPGSVGETCCWAILLGALLLLTTGVASWKTMLSIFVGGGLTAWLFNVCGPDTAAAHFPWYMHLVTGGFAFGAVFMATDPVTSARTECGKWIYGFLIGFMAVVIRVLNPGYPEGMMLAILLMNAFAPLIDWCVVQVNINRRAKRVSKDIKKNAGKTIVAILAIVSTTLVSCNNDSEVIKSSSEDTNIVALTPQAENIFLPSEYANLGAEIYGSFSTLLHNIANNGEEPEYNFLKLAQDNYFAAINGLLFPSINCPIYPELFGYTEYEIIGKINHILAQAPDIEVNDALYDISIDIQSTYGENQPFLYTYLTICYYSYMAIQDFEEDIVMYAIELDEEDLEELVDWVCNLVTGSIGIIYGEWVGGIIGGMTGGAVGILTSLVVSKLGSDLCDSIVVEPNPQPDPQPNPDPNPDPNPNPDGGEDSMSFFDRTLFGEIFPNYDQYVDFLGVDVINADADINWFCPPALIGYGVEGEYSDLFDEFLQNLYVVHHVKQMIVNYER